MTQGNQKIIVLDPGHGSTRGASGYDSGVVDQRTGRHEAQAALETTLTLKKCLTDLGYKVVLTHDGDDGGKPDLAWRVRMAQGLGAAALISVHFNSVGTYPLVYFAPGKPSERLARMMAVNAGIPEEKIWPSNHSRFKGLYIDAFPDERPAVLWEVAAIDRAPAEGEKGRLDRLELCRPVSFAIDSYLKRGQ